MLLSHTSRRQENHESIFRKLRYPAILPLYKNILEHKVYTVHVYGPLKLQEKDN